MKPIDAGITLMVMMLWGFNFVTSKWALAQVPPIFLMALRFALVAALLVPFVKLPRKKMAGIAVLSVTLGCVHFSLMFTGLDGLDASVAAIAIQIQVPFAAILAAILYKDRLGWRRVLGMGLAFAGIVVLAGEPRSSVALVPLALVIAASFVWAVGNIQIKQIGAVNGFSLTGYMSLLAVPQLLLTSYVLESDQIAALAKADGWLWGSLLYIVVINTIIGYGAWYRILRRYSINQAMPFTLLVPVFGVIFSVLFLNEPLGWQVVIGGIATVAGVAIIVIRRPRLADPEATSKTV
jgi:O-acetylserine/cysteine efflux transporter